MDPSSQQPSHRDQAAQCALLALKRAFRVQVAKISSYNLEKMQQLCEEGRIGIYTCVARYS